MADEWAALAAAVQGAAQIASSYALGDVGYHDSKRLIRYQNQIQQDNWNMVNEYNTPEAQRARMEAAGFNPNLLAGGSTTSGNSGDVGSVTTHMPRRPDLAPNMLDSMYKVFQAEQVNQQTENLVEQGAVYKAQEALLRTQEAALRSQIPGMGADSDVKVGTVDSRIKGVTLDNENKEANTNNLYSMINNRNVQNNMMIKQMAVYDEQAKWYADDRKRISEQVNTLVSQAALNYARMHNINASTDVIEAQLPYVASEISQRIKNMEADHALKVIEEGIKKQQKIGVELDNKGKRLKNVNQQYRNENMHDFGQEESGGPLAGTMAGFGSFVKGGFDTIGNLF